MRLKCKAVLTRLCCTRNRRVSLTPDDMRLDVNPRNIVQLVSRLSRGWYSLFGASPSILIQALGSAFLSNFGYQQIGKYEKSLKKKKKKKNIVNGYVKKYGIPLCTAYLMCIDCACGF